MRRANPDQSCGALTEREQLVAAQQGRRRSQTTSIPRTGFAAGAVEAQHVPSADTDRNGSYTDCDASSVAKHDLGERPPLSAPQPRRFTTRFRWLRYGCGLAVSRESSGSRNIPVVSIVIFTRSDLSSPSRRTAAAISPTGIAGVAGMKASLPASTRCKARPTTSSILC